jgi:hypothetical protein
LLVVHCWSRRCAAFLFALRTLCVCSVYSYPSASLSLTS